jgi:hypothetical protein
LCGRKSNMGAVIGLDAVILIVKDLDAQMRFFVA